MEYLNSLIIKKCIVGMLVLANLKYRPLDDALRLHF